MLVPKGLCGGWIPKLEGNPLKILAFIEAPMI